MAKRKRRGRRKGSRKPAMPHKKRGRGRRARNATLGAGAQIALGVGGYITAGLLGSLAQAYLLSATSSANTIRLTRSAIGAVGALGTAMLVGEPTMSSPLATGMAANAGVQILGVGADAAGVTVSNKKFMGLAPGSTASAVAATAAAATAAAATAAAATAAAAAAAAAAVPPSPIVATLIPPGEFKDSKGADLAVLPIATKKHTQEDGSVVTVEVLGVNVGGANIPVIDASGAPWVRNPQTSEFATVSSSSLSGAFPPWAGYPGYDKRRFPQQAVSRPAQVAPHVQGYANYAPAMSGYANYAPAMSGYANFAPAMSGWDPGYGG